MIMKILRGKRRERGQSSIETAFALLILFGFFIFLWDGINLGYNWVSMQFVLSRGLRDVHMGRNETTTPTITDGINTLATQLSLDKGSGDKKLTSTVAFGSFGWYNSANNRPVIHITLQRTVDFGPFLQKISNLVGLPTAITITVNGYAETPP